MDYAAEFGLGGVDAASQVEHHQTLYQGAGLEGNFPHIDVQEDTGADAFGHQLSKLVGRRRFARGKIAREFPGAGAIAEKHQLEQAWLFQRKVEVDIENLAHAGIEVTFQARGGEARGQLGESIIGEGVQQAVSVGVMPVHSHGSDTHSGSDATHGDCVYAFGVQQLAGFGGNAGRGGFGSHVYSVYMICVGTQEGGGRWGWHVGTLYNPAFPLASSEPMADGSKPAFLPFTRPTLDEETIGSVVEVLRSGWLTSNGPKLQAFEAQLSAFFGGRPVRTFNSGTCTMEIALRVAGIGPGDEVVTTPNSWAATANVILQVGARPVFADIDARSHNLDMDKAAEAVTSRTRALIPVHMCGLPCDMDKLYGLAKARSLRVVEDAAQAIGSTWKGQRIGAFGDMVSFSFQVNKNIMTAEGGCLVLNNAEEAKIAEKYRLQGVTRSGLDGIDVDLVGGKFNMTEISAALGLGQMKHLAAFNARRLALTQHYFRCFGTDFEEKYGAELPVADFEQSNWHMFHIVLPERIRRADFMQKMADRGIGLGYHYAAIHLFTLYRERGFKEGMFPVAERVCRQIVTLPLFPLMTESDVERVVAETQAILAA